MCTIGKIITFNLVTGKLVKLFPEFHTRRAICILLIVVLVHIDIENFYLLVLKEGDNYIPVDLTGYSYVLFISRSGCR